MVSYCGHQKRQWNTEDWDIRNDVLKYKTSCVRDKSDGIGPSKQGNERMCITGAEWITVVR